MKGKKLRQGQGRGDQQGEPGEGRSMRSRAIWCPVQLKELSHTWVRGTHSLFTVPARSLSSNLPKNIFIFLEWSTSPTSPCSPSALNTRPTVYSIYQRSIQRLQTVVMHLFFPPTQSGLQPKPPATTPTTISLAPFPQPR